MALTRADVEAVLVKRTGAWMGLVSMDNTTADGSNADLNDAIAYALTRLSSAPDDYTDVDDDDLSAITADNIPALMDVAEVRVLETVLGNLTTVDVQIGPRKESYSQRAALLSELIADKQARIDMRYGLGTVDAEMGVMSFGFVATEDDYS